MATGYEPNIEGALTVLVDLMNVGPAFIKPVEGEAVLSAK